MLAGDEPVLRRAEAAVFAADFEAVDLGARPHPEIDRAFDRVIAPKRRGAAAIDVDGAEGVRIEIDGRVDARAAAVRRRRREAVLENENVGETSRGARARTADRDDRVAERIALIGCDARAVAHDVGDARDRFVLEGLAAHGSQRLPGRIAIDRQLLPLGFETRGRLRRRRRRGRPRPARGVGRRFGFGGGMRLRRTGFRHADVDRRQRLLRAGRRGAKREGERRGGRSKCKVAEFH